MINYEKRKRGVLDMFDYEEIRLSRALARSIEDEMRKGTVFSDELLAVYNQLCMFYVKQMEAEVT
jgi:hypothetical protein